jgi:hypothetical protein
LTAEPLIFENHHYPVRIFFAPSKGAWKALMRDLDIAVPYPQTAHDTPARMTWIDVPGRPRHLVITITKKARQRHAAEVIGLLVHEIVHVVQKIEEFIGGRLDDESAAYLTQSLTQWLLASYEETRKHTLLNYRILADA